MSAAVAVDVSRAGSGAFATGAGAIGETGAGVRAGLNSRTGASDCTALGAESAGADCAGAGSAGAASSLANCSGADCFTLAVPSAAPASGCGEACCCGSPTAAAAAAVSTRCFGVGSGPSSAGGGSGLSPMDATNTFSADGGSYSVVLACSRPTTPPMVSRKCLMPRRAPRHRQAHLQSPNDRSYLQAGAQP